jgi:hypothetical protein
VRTPPRLSRRRAVGGAAALTALVVSGCTQDGASRTGSGPAATGSSESSEAPTRAPVPPDVTLAAAVLRDEQSMLDRVAATARRHPGLAGTVSGARSTHRAHVRLLRQAVPDGARRTPPRPFRPGQVPRRPGSALAALVRAETRLSSDGQRNAVRAESGSFARVLASMAAASAQQAARLADVSADRR